MEVHPSEYSDILEECYISTKVLAKTLFPERFFGPFTVLHDRIFDLIDSDAPLIAIAAPRGIGKTSIVGLAKTAQAILFQDRKFLPYVSSSHDAAVLQTENLKRELVSNQLIKKLFEPVKIKKSTGIDESFSKKTWVGTQTLVMPRGSGQQIRGILHGNSRPDLIIVDDFEDAENILNENLRKKYKEWFHADLLKCVSRYDRNFKIIYIDTLKHEDALLQDLLDNPDWESIRLEICDDNYDPIAPEFFSKDDIMKEVAYHKQEGILDVFFREYRNLPISTEDPVFDAKNFRKYREVGDYLQLEVETEGQKTHWADRKKALFNSMDNVLPFEKTSTQFDYNDYAAKTMGKVAQSDILNVVLVDPAKTVKMQSADSAIIGVGVQRSTQQIFVRRVVSGKLYPNELYDEMFSMINELNAMVFGVEVTGLNEFITQPIKNEMRVRNCHAIFQELKARKAKEERVAMLAPYYQNGYIYHNGACCDKLESQLIGFPRSKLWDVMDALAYIIPMIDELNWMFDPHDIEDEDTASMYKELKNETPLIYKSVI